MCTCDDEAADDVEVEMTNGEDSYQGQPDPDGAHDPVDDEFPPFRLFLRFISTTKTT